MTTTARKKARRAAKQGPAPEVRPVLLDVTAFNRAIENVITYPDRAVRAANDLWLAMLRVAEQTGDASAKAFADDLAEVLERFQVKYAPRHEDGPTKETARKHRHDPVRYMSERGTLDDGHLDVIEDIRSIRYAIEKSMGSGSSALARVRVQGGGKVLDLADRLSERLAAVLSHVYRPWAADHGDKASIDVRVEERWRPPSPEFLELCRMTGGGMDAPLSDVAPRRRQIARTDAGEFFVVRRRPKRHRIRTRRKELPITPFELVVAVVDGGRSVREFEKRHRIAHGALTAVFVAALDDFGRRLDRAERDGKVPRRRKRPD